MCRELRTSGDARLGRILRAVPQVMSLRREHDSNSGDIVSQAVERGKLKSLPSFAGLGDPTWAIIGSLKVARDMNGASASYA